MKEVTFKDEWCAEAYMETDYSLIKEGQFIKNLHAFSTFLFSIGKLKTATSAPYHNKNIRLQDREWKPFDLINYFYMFAGKYFPKESFEIGGTPLVSSSDTNNGIMTFTDLNPKYENCITIGKIGMSSYYQPISFVASSDVTILKPKFEMSAYMGLFIISVIGMDAYKWSYGRQIRLNDSKKIRIMLPINNSKKPDWEFMEYYIKSLRYSHNLKEITNELA
jgi:type I restriction enzyme M protein